MNPQKLYARLAEFAQKHANLLAKQKNNLVKMPATGKTKSKSFIVVNEDHAETVKILGSGSSEEICQRIHWYISYFPQFLA